jgi:transcriptional regulator
MCRIVDELAVENGVLPAAANRIFAGITAVLVKKIPELEQVLDDIFSECDDVKLKEHTSKMAAIIQEHHWKDKFRDRQMPPQVHIIIPSGGGDQLL